MYIEHVEGFGFLLLIIIIMSLISLKMAAIIMCSKHSIRTDPFKHMLGVNLG